jgi:hypothetical protein
MESEVRLFLGRHRAAAGQNRERRRSGKTLESIGHADFSV